MAAAAKPDPHASTRLPEYLGLRIAAARTDANLSRVPYPGHEHSFRQPGGPCGNQLARRLTEPARGQPGPLPAAGQVKAARAARPDGLTLPGSDCILGNEYAVCSTRYTVPSMQGT